MILASSRVGAPDAPRVAVVLHGILGSGKNWRALARRLVERTPDWQVVLVDLRNHGESPPAAPPHDLDACARDVLDTLAALGLPLHRVIGHSFGGKVALAVLARAPDVDVWVLDAVPFAVPPVLDGEIGAVIAAARSIPTPVAGHEVVRRAFLDAGFSELLAGWMTTNLRREGDGLVWRFNLDAVPEMLASYAATDFEDLMRDHPGQVHLVRAGRSDRWTPEVQARLAWLADERVVDVHLLPDAGHWLHVDDPDAVLRLLA